jgi:hypothetical protein
MRLVVLALVAATALTPRGCGMPSNPQPPPGEHHLPITFQHWIYPGACSAANVSMWVRYKGTPYPSSQQEIIDYMWDWYYWDVGPDGSLSPWAVQQALWEWSRIDTRDDFYTGESEKRQAVADMKKGISVGNPTIVITDGQLHSKLVVGGTWTQLPNYQPNVEYILTADPQDYGPRNDTVGYWLSSVGNADYTGLYVRLIQTYGQRYSAVAELAEFEYWGGTYYGDENPPDGCPECPPIMAAPAPDWLHSVVSLLKRPAALRASVNPRSGAGSRPSNIGQSAADRPRLIGPQQQKNHAVRRFIFVPKPHARTREDVVANVMAGMDQTNLRNAEGWEDLDSLRPAGRISATGVDYVESLTGYAPYWIVTLRADGVPFAQALVSEAGWLLSIMRVRGGATVPEIRSSEWARGVATGLGYRASRARRVHMSNNLTRDAGSADYHPFYEITSAGEPPLYVSQDGHVFRVDSHGKGIGFWKDGERRFTRIH